MGLGQGRRIIDAVTGHGDYMAFCLEFFHHVCFLVRQYIGHNLIYVQLSRDGLGCSPSISGQHHNPHSCGMQIVNGLLRGRFDRVRDGHQTGEFAVAGQEHYSLPQLPHFFSTICKF